jgi:predicted HicB family RNase H-like nuclease
MRLKLRHGTNETAKLESMHKEEHMKITREQTILRMPQELKEELMKEAQEKGYSFNAYILVLIDIARQCRSG